MIASPGSYGDIRPLRSSSRPQVFQVPGMNWDRPSAPTGETAFGFQPDSASIWAAMTAGPISLHCLPDLSTHGAYAAGTCLLLSPPVPPAASGVVASSPAMPTNRTIGTNTM